MKKVIITGAGGFIGSHLSELCVKKGYKVRAFVHYNSSNHFGWLENSKYKKDMDIIASDIRDFDAVSKAMKGCDTIFHLAALIGIPYSYRSPLAYIRTNIEGTYNVLEAARNLTTKEILITSTSETYGTAQYVPIDEKHPLVGQSPYSASKISADQLAISFYRSFGLPIKIVRPFNTYGPRQSARAIIPSVISQIISGNKKLKLGNIAPTRDFTFVEDTVRGFLTIAQNKKLYGEFTNIGTNTEISIGDLVNLISKILKTDVSIRHEKQRVRARKSEVERLVCDNKKIKRLTAWRPKVKLKEGLIKTIRFIEENLEIYKPEIYNV